MVFSCHNLWVRSRQTRDDGSYTIDGTHYITAGQPLFSADTLEEAEAWRIEMIKILQLDVDMHG